MEANQGILSTGKMSIDDVFGGALSKAKKNVTKSASDAAGKNINPAIKKLSDQLGE